MCFRREANFCGICFTTAITPILGSIAPQSNAAQTSFGLSISGAAIAAQAEGTSCTSGYLIIPNFQATVSSYKKEVKRESVKKNILFVQPVIDGTVPASLDRICGRVFTTISANIEAGASVCSKFSLSALLIVFL